MDGIFFTIGNIVQQIQVEYSFKFHYISPVLYNVSTTKTYLFCKFIKKMKAALKVNNFTFKVPKITKYCFDGILAVFFKRPQ